MALIIETGTVVAGAESYCTVAECDTYHTNNANAAWAAAVTSDKEAALRKATRYIDGNYRQRWKGLKSLPNTQPLEWPRYNVSIYGTALAGNVIPQRVKDAVCELALRALAGALAGDISAGIKRQKVDVIETEYVTGTAAGSMRYPEIDNLICDYLTASNELIRG